MKARHSNGPVKAGGKTVEVVRITITEASGRALEG
jgi:hypothetical protein